MLRGKRGTARPHFLAGYCRATTQKEQPRPRAGAKWRFWEQGSGRLCCGNVIEVGTIMHTKLVSSAGSPYCSKDTWTTPGSGCASAILWLLIHELQHGPSYEASTFC